MSGGDGVQMRETAKRLAQRGHQVVAVNSDRPEVAGFDLVALAAGLGFAAAAVYLHRHAPATAAGVQANDRPRRDAPAVVAAGAPYPEDAAG